MFLWQRRGYRIAIVGAALAIFGVGAMPLGSAVLAVHDRFVGRQRMFILEEGVGSSVPGLHWIDYAKCYSAHVDTRDIEVGDYFNWPHESLFAVLARSFARHHNARVASLLSADGISDCRPTTNWGAAWTELSEYLHLTYRVKAGAAYARGISNVDFNVTIPDASHATIVRQRVCAILVAHDAVPALISLRQWPQQELVRFRCPDIGGPA